VPNPCPNGSERFGYLSATDDRCGAECDRAAPGARLRLPLL